MEYNRIKTGERIYQARTSKKIKQIDMCNILEMSQSNYSRIETGMQDITLPALFKLAETLEVSVAWIIGINDYSNLTSEETFEIEKFVQYVISKR